MMMESMSNTVMNEEGDDDDASKRRKQLFKCYVDIFVRQVHNGCGNAECTTPTCYSCVTRITRGPPRQPTRLTALTTAYFIAAQDNPDSRICPNLDVESAVQHAATGQHGVPPPQTEEQKISPRDHKSLIQSLFATVVEHGLLRSDKTLRSSDDLTKEETTKIAHFCERLEGMLEPPPELSTYRRPLSSHSKISPHAHRPPRPYISDEEAVRVVEAVMNLLIFLSSGDNTDLQATFVDHAVGMPKRNIINLSGSTVSRVDLKAAVAHPLVLDLVRRLFLGLAARKCHSEMLGLLDRQRHHRRDQSLAVTAVHWMRDNAVAQARLGSARKAASKAPSPMPHEDGMPDESEKDEQILQCQAELLPLYGAVLLRVAQIAFLDEWDGGWTIMRWSNGAGAALEIVSDLYAERQSLRLQDCLFQNVAAEEQLEHWGVAAAEAFIHRKENVNKRHIFSYPFLFKPEDLIRMFRVVNFASMLQGYNKASAFTDLWTKMTNKMPPDFWRMFQPHIRSFNMRESNYLILNVRRDHVLEDAMHQLCGIDEELLLKPLRIWMGHTEAEGETGIDHGGVSQEFFNLLIAEAFHTDNGMFTVLEDSQMQWFQPGSMEPVFRFKLLGVLLSLAIYNGVTLPVSLPLALYARLLYSFDPSAGRGKPALAPKINADLIADGWPHRSRALKELLRYDGDVSEDFHLSYVFEYTFLGESFEINMLKGYWRRNEDRKQAQLNCSAPVIADCPATLWGLLVDDKVRQTIIDDVYQSDRDAYTPHKVFNDIGLFAHDDAPLVTNETRKKYVRDYVNWLTFKSIQPQFASFNEGFHACLSGRALSMMSPEHLKRLVEGEHTISIDAIKGIARYDAGYHPSHPFVKDFWSIVSGYTEEEKRLLLEFVTASERIPATGVQGMTFVIQRNGGDSERLPTSSTCFGRLLLPQYESKNKLEAKLGVAIRNAQGFGTA